MVSLYSGKYTIKSTYDMICKSKVEAYANTSLNQVWETIWGQIYMEDMLYSFGNG